MIPADAGKLLASLHNDKWLDTQVFPPLAWAIPEIIPEGAVLLAAAPKCGKSWLALDIALAAASGGNALGIEIAKRPVLYCALEDGDRRLQDRGRRLLVNEAIPEEFEYLTSRSRAGSPTPSPPGSSGETATPHNP